MNETAVTIIKPSKILKFDNFNIEQRYQHLTCAVICEMKYGAWLQMTLNNLTTFAGGEINAVI